MKRKLIIFSAIFLISVIGFSFSERDRKRAIAHIVRHMKRWNIPNRITKAFWSVKREYFVQNRETGRWPSKRAAYSTRPLAIGYGQTISGTRMVAWMTYMSNPQPTDKILEIGTGSGFQSAILSYFGSKVYSIEIVRPLGLDAKKVHAKRGYSSKITTKVADGYFGWKKYAPFNKILVTCGTNHIPPALVRQLARGGTMIIPVGNPYGKQRMIVLKKDRMGRIKTRAYFADHFVPMTGRALQKFRRSRGR